MAQAITNKGTAQSKTASTTLQISDVSLVAGQLLLVGVIYETDAAFNGPKWGARELKYIPDNTANKGDTRLRLYRMRAKHTATRNLVATWASAMSARAMIAVAVDEASLKDVYNINSFDAGTTAPNTASATSTEANSVAIGFLGSLGPSTDTIGTVGDGHTSGQRVGTTGGGDASNVTLHQTYKLLTSTGDIKSSISGATGRAWVCSVVNFIQSQVFTVSRAEYHPYDGTPNSEAVVFIMKDESSDELFRVKISREDFNEMTDQEVTDYITAACQWWDGKISDGNPSPDYTPDATFNTRVASFVNDTVTL